MSKFIQTIYKKKSKNFWDKYYPNIPKEIKVIKINKDLKKKNEGKIIKDIFYKEKCDLVICLSHLGYAYENNSEKIYLSDPLWRRKAQNILSKIGTITLLSDITEGAQRADAFNYFATQPIEVDYLLGFARLLRVERIEKIMEIEFEMAEFS